MERAESVGERVYVLERGSGEGRRVHANFITNNDKWGLALNRYA